MINPASLKNQAKETVPEPGEEAITASALLDLYTRGYLYK